MLRLLASVWLGAVAWPEARAQLAITEVMSWAHTNCLGGSTDHPDFWELTNFGTNAVDLTGYMFCDKEHPFPEVMWLLPSISIEPRESIVFVRYRPSVPDAATFCGWWGITANYPRIYFYSNPGEWSLGFDDRGDGVRLWDAHTNVVDQAYFGEATFGATFTYSTNSGRFDEVSELGICGAFRAATCNDIGSPGIAPCGPVRMAIAQQPVSQSVDVGMDVTFTVEGYGRPQPQFEWYFNDAPVHKVSGAGETASTLINYAGSGLAWKAEAKATDLVIRNVSPTDAGEYFVVLTNGFECVTSAVVALSINADPGPPRIECPPPEWRWPALDGRPQTNLVVAPGQKAEFAVVARGCPLPSFQWSWSGDGRHFGELDGATNSTLIIADAHVANAGTYYVSVVNLLGTTNACALLTVKPKPRLKITEAMALGFPDWPKNWWELTNLGGEAVNLCGFRWDDEPGNIGGGPTVTNNVIVQPGESVILLEGATAEEFINHWGAGNLPPNVQFITYGSNGLSDPQDEITVWNPAATNDTDYIDTVSYYLPPLGASLWFDTNICRVAAFGVPSMEGECGAFRAARNDDVGSPGWTAWTPACFTAIRHEGSVVRLEWKAQPGSINLLQYTSQLAEPPSASIWTEAGTYAFPGATGTATDTVIENEGPRFYRLVRIAPNSCYCHEEDE